MPVIPKRLGSGGAYLAPNKQAGSPTLLELMEAVADDLAGLQLASAIAADGSTDVVAADVAAIAAATQGADIAAFTDPPSAAEMALLRTFVNAGKADLAAHILRLGELRTLANEAKADFNLLRALVTDIRTKINAAQGYAITLTKAS